MLTLACILLGFGIPYALLDLALLTGLRRLRRQDAPSTQALPAASILVCARNEEQGIEACIRSLLAQAYQGDWEIWVADDRSTDATPRILARLQLEHPDRIHIHTITDLLPGLSPKKSAISQH